MAISQPEFQIPQNEDKAPAYDELAAAYANIGSSDVSGRQKVIERVISPESRVLHSIRLSIETMRDYTLTHGLSPAKESVSFRTYLRRTLTQLVLPNQTQSKSLTIAHLINKESEIGGQLFADEAPVGIERRFFFDEDWFFSDSALVSKAKPFEQAIRYQVHETGVYKIIDGKDHRPIDGVELERLMHVAKIYHDTLKQTIYKHVPSRSDYDLAA